VVHPLDLARAEAFRVVPGILAMRQRHEASSEHDAALLFMGYLRSCHKMGMRPEESWMCLFTACLSWLQMTLTSSYEGQEQEIIASMAAQAASWVSEEYGVGGI
jgi:hypothetical protein